MTSSTIGLNRAVTLIAEKRANPGKGRRFGADPGKLLGEHPQKGGPVTVKNGRYGPYVANNGVNATLPSDKTPDTITLDEAIVLLDARAERTGGMTSRRKRPARAKTAQTRGAAEGSPRRPRSAPRRADPKPRHRARRRRKLPSNLAGKSATLSLNLQRWRASARP